MKAEITSELKDQLLVTLKNHPNNNQLPVTNGNDDHGYGYKTLEIYHLKLKDANLASANFNKAIELDTSIDIDDYAEELKQLSRNEVTT